MYRRFLMEFIIMKKYLLIILLTAGALEAIGNARDMSKYFDTLEQASHPALMSLTEKQRNDIIELCSQFGNDLQKLIEKYAAENGIVAPLHFKWLLKYM